MPFCVPNVNGWLIPDPSRSGNFGTDYHLRLVTAEIGLLANDAREALYVGCFMDDTGEPLIGGRRYTVHFDADQLPPVAEFWSFTMCTHPPGFLTESSTNRYALGTLTPGFSFDDDGSVDIYIQRTSPGADRESNWLPTTRRSAVPDHLPHVQPRPSHPQPHPEAPLDTTRRLTPPPGNSSRALAQARVLWRPTPREAAQRAPTGHKGLKRCWRTKGARTRTTKSWRAFPRNGLSATPSEWRSMWRKGNTTSANAPTITQRSARFAMRSAP